MLWSLEILIYRPILRPLEKISSLLFLRYKIDGTQGVKLPVSLTAWQQDFY